MGDFSKFSVTTTVQSIPLKIAHQKDLPLCDLVTLSNGEDDSTGLKIWLCSRFLLHLLMRDESLRDIILGKDILEIGCGTGVVGCALLSSGEKIPSPANYYFTDCDVEVLRLVDYNCKLNSIAANLFNTYLLNVQDSDISLPLENPANLDLILACDVIYDRSFVRPLFQSAHRLLHQSVESASSWCGVKEKVFALAWCARMNLTEDQCVASEDECLEYICDEATLAGFDIKKMKRVIEQEEVGEFRDSSCNLCIFFL